LIESERDRESVRERKKETKREREGLFFVSSGREERGVIR
jgi:hypothetical protein